MNKAEKDIKKQEERERNHLLVQVQNFMEGPMVVLGIVWLALLIIELVGELHPILQGIGYVIWGIFIVDFVIKIILAPKKKRFLKRNILTMLSLAIPALRVFRIFRIIRVLRSFRFLRSIRLVKVLGTINRNMRSLNNVMDRRGMKFVLLLTLIVLFSGAAGMYAFERGVEGEITSYGEAIWWTLMLMVSFGTGYWPETTEGRVLCIILAIYGLAVFSYITASLASYFVDVDAEEDQANVAGAAQLEEVKSELQALRKEIQKRST